MSFKIWFKAWIKSFCNLLTVSAKPYKSDAQRKREQERRKKAKYAHPDPFRTKKRRARQHHNGNLKVVQAFLNFTALSLGIFFLPLGLFHWGYQNAKSRATARRRSNPSFHHRQTHLPSAGSSAKKVQTAVTPSAQSGMHTSRTKPKRAPSSAKERSPVSTPMTQEAVSAAGAENIAAVAPNVLPMPDTSPKVVSADEPILSVPSENTPKSRPKQSNDQYIRKRLSLTDISVNTANKLEIGIYLEMRTTSHPSDGRETVELLLDENSVGYLSQQDIPPYIACLRLNRRPYAVITDIDPNSPFPRYELETWFPSSR